MDPEALFRLLVELGWIEPEELKSLLEDYESGDRSLFDFLEASGVGSKEEVLQIVAEALGAELVDLKAVELTPLLFDAIPEDLVRIYRCIPIHDSTDLLKICLVDPLDGVAVDELRNLVGRPIEVVFADPEIVEEVVRERLMSNSSVLSQPTGTASVFASLGAKSDPQSTVVEHGQGNTSGIRMVGLALLAASATAAAAFYLVQKNSVQSVKSLLGEFESFQETHRLSRLNWEQEARDLELGMEELRRLFDRSEVDAHKLGQLEAGIQRLEGKFEGLSEIRPSSPTSRDGPPEANSGIDE